MASRFSVVGGLTLAMAVLGALLVSGTPYSRASTAGTKHGPKTLAAPSSTDQVTQRLEAAHVVSTFELYSVNNLESVTVRYVDDVIDPESKKQVDHLMRCLRTEREKPIDPKLVDAMRALAHEVDKPLGLVSGYRAPLYRWEHNYHNRAQAADIRVEGVPAYKLRNMAKKLGIKGVGHYPTTNMIHVDVRDDAYYWIDWSGPTFGEPKK